jgi:hypothetical protein
MRVLRTPTRREGFRSLATIAVIGNGHHLPCPLRRAARHQRVELKHLAMIGGDSEDGNEEDEFLATVASCDVVTFDHRTMTRQHIDRLVQLGIDLQPNPLSFLLTRDPLACARVLRSSGFAVVDPVEHDTELRNCTVRIARGRSGDVANVASAPRCVEIAKSIADGLDITGLVTVRFVLTDGHPYIRAVSLGPEDGPSDPVSVSTGEAHIRALLDWPLNVFTS